MKKMRVYLDTSVIGGCFDEEFAPWSKGLIEDLKAGLIEAVVSEIVADEIEDAPVLVRQVYNQIINLGAEVLTVEPDVLALFRFYEQRRILTKKYQNDAMHIALATVAKVDVLVSWNFKHIVRLDKIRQFNAANIEFGYGTLMIYSPREVAHD